MARPRWQWQYLLLFLTYSSLSLAASPTTFCKCTCYSNSTIIPLDGPPSSPSMGSNNSAENSSTPAHRTCNDCNKQFCLDLDLPICNEATEDDVFTTCFQRDSAKDQAVVFIFIFATVGLLAWAAMKPWVLKWRDSARLRRSYTPVASGAGGDGQ
ncbi:hypothetical protein LTR37_001336 [Vermiconidia calcicola]|uniref:Uncharacterized protein n=1 Tax=Vermiconidia calcicola TaxID=1690605 RepID=A0ACC3NZ27_9PEZI|nr:hypothetical protein LTR37_001336 [Vermiconidia calcicola]